MGYYNGGNNDSYDLTYYRARANRSNWYNGSYGYPSYGCGCGNDRYGCDGGYGYNDCD